VDKLTKAATTENLATGKTKVADLEELHAYLDDKHVKTAVEKSFSALETASRYQTKLSISRKDAALLEAWNIVCRYLIMAAIVRNGCRTGVMQNMTIQELQAANKFRGKFVVLVAQHKSVNTYGPEKNHHPRGRLRPIRKVLEDQDQDDSHESG